jgi:SpoVK/Ycf46/Vps4 family AAA+-type ATPase
LLDVSQARDKYYGETEKMITGIFRDYEKQVGEGGAFPILFFNEGDSIFQRRIDSDQNSSHTDNTVQTILLNELERFQGILLVTTNTPKHFDKAFERRFQFRLQFNAPGEQTRLQLLRNALPEGKLPVLQRIACECQVTAAELQNALRRLHIEGLCGITTLDRAAAIWDMLRSDKIEKQRIGFRV